MHQIRNRAWVQFGLLFLFGLIFPGCQNRQQPFTQPIPVAAYFTVEERSAIFEIPDDAIDPMDYGKMISRVRGLKITPAVIKLHVGEVFQFKHLNVQAIDTAGNPIGKLIIYGTAVGRVGHVFTCDFPKTIKAVGVGEGDLVISMPTFGSQTLPAAAPKGVLKVYVEK